jgi:hypothetical protein
MIVSRRLLLLGLIALGSQLATGCYCSRPILFPRLPLCANGACNGPVFPRLAAAVTPPIAGPVVSGPVYDAPISHGFGYGGPVYGGAGIGDPGCTACGHGGAGIPLATVPFSGGPIAGTTYAPQPYGGQPYNFQPYGQPGAAGPNPNFAVPMNMPSASTGGIPFDSSLAPTVKPPVVNAQKLDTAPDGKKILTAGK